VNNPAQWRETMVMNEGGYSMRVYYCSLFNEIHLVLPVNKWLCGTVIGNEIIPLHLPRKNWHYIGVL
jgi:hypothetical protein